MSTTDEISQRRTQLSEAKLALLKKRLRGKEGNKGTELAFSEHSGQIIPPKPLEAENLASFAQQQLWFLRELYPDSAAYHMHGVVRLTGKFDRSALETSLNKVIKRHEILRTTFRPSVSDSSDGEIEQIIHPELAISIDLIDLSEQPAPERRDCALALCRAEARQPFDLLNGPLIRASALKLSREEHWLRLTLHHIISDEWSTGIFWRELSHFYCAEMGCEVNSLPSLPIQYCDYAYWQRYTLAPQTSSSQLPYWQKQLGGELPQIQLPFARSVAVHTQDGSLKSIDLASDLASQLRKLSRENHTTLFVTLLSAFYVLLYRYTGQRDLLVGTPIANRGRAEVQDLIGFFINSLVLRTRLSPHTSFLDFLHQVRETVTEALANQHLPFEQVVKQLRPDRQLGHNPFFQIMFVFQQDQTRQVQMPELTLEQIKFDSGVAKFDLTLFINESDGRLSAAIEYNTGRFDALDIERMLGHLDTLLAGIAANPAEQLARLPLMAPDEIALVMNLWSGIAEQTSKSQDTQGVMIDQIIAEQAARCPDALAVTFKGEELSYGRLNELSETLAHQLKHLGIGPNKLVALCFERSTEMIVALLGVLKAGGAYVPLDPAYPAERIIYMLKETEAAVILTQTTLLKELPPTHSVILTFEVHTQQWVAAAERVARTAVAANHNRPARTHECIERSPQDLAYVIYTSGSTGRPKGVMVSHANLVYSTMTRLNVYPAKPDRFLLLSSYSFDSSVVGIFWTLCSGATLILPAQGEETAVRELARLIRSHQITHLLCLPSLYSLLLEYANRKQLQALSTVIVAGEICPPSIAGAHYNELPDCSLYNEYGPTEGTVWSSVYRIQPQDSTRASIPIGRPISGTLTLVLDENRQPVPIGVPGELYIAGPGISLGYLHNSELTKKSFTALSSADSKYFVALESLPHVRFYRTGDLVCWTENGTLDFLGRADDQIKIRGFRIELAEIEATILSMPCASQAAVILHKGATDREQQLAAYVVQNDGFSLSSEEIRARLRDRLPPYMVPAQILSVDHMPHTPNGKLDRTKLAAMSVPLQSSSEPFTPPVDELEIQLTAIWEDVLNIRPIGRNDNYFDLGGHSLQAIRLFQRIWVRFGKDMPLSSLFHASTIADQADLIRTEGWTPDWTVLVPIQPSGTKKPIFCAHAVGGNVLSLRTLAGKMGNDQPFYAFQSQGLDGKQEIPHRVEEMATYYINEMRSVQARGPYRLAGQSSGGFIAFEMAQQLLQSGEQVEMLALIDTYVPAHLLYPAASAASSHNASGNTPKSLRVPVSNRVQFHVDRIAQRGLSHVIESTKIRVRKSIVRGKQRVENSFARMLYRIYDMRGHPLPVTLRPIYVRTAVQRALRTYQPRPYHGDAVLFRATESLDAYLEPIYGSQQGWDRYIEGTIWVLDIAGGHNLEEEPAVDNLASQMTVWLEEHSAGMTHLETV